VAAGLGNTWWQYLLLFVCVAASWAGAPAIGTAALGIAAVAASQRRLDLAAVIVVAVVAGEAGGLCGYAIGRRWGRQLLERPGRHQARREKVMERGEGLYARWGWLAVFVTPAIVSGTAKMPPYRFAFWNLLDSLMWTVSVAASAYGVGRLATGHHTWHDVAILVVGLGAGALVIVTAVRRRRRRNARLAGNGLASVPVSFMYVYLRPSANCLRTSTSRSPAGDASVLRVLSHSQ
jgi:membrane protein DedA with SNARE-associated domain